MKKTLPRGRYIVFEGIESVGKSTQRDLLSERLLRAGIPVRTIREPAGDAVGHAIRKILLDPQYEIDARTELFLFSAARASLMSQLDTWLQSGLWIICSRNYLSSIAYQGYGREGGGLSIEEIRHISELPVTVAADLQLVLDAPVKVTERRTKRRAPGHRFDSLSNAFMTRARNGYLAEAKMRKLPVIDATASINEVAAAVWSYVEPLLASE